MRNYNNSRQTIKLWYYNHMYHDFGNKFILKMFEESIIHIKALLHFYIIITSVIHLLLNKFNY